MPAAAVPVTVALIMEWMAWLASRPGMPAATAAELTQRVSAACSPGLSSVLAFGMTYLPGPRSGPVPAARPGPASSSRPAPEHLGAAGTRHSPVIISGDCEPAVNVGFGQLAIVAARMQARLARPSYRCIPVLRRGVFGRNALIAPSGPRRSAVLAMTAACCHPARCWV